MKQKVEIILLYEELSRNIKADIVNLEKSRNANIPDGAKPLVVLSDNEGDEYTLAQQIDAAVNKAVGRMSAYLVIPSPFVRRISTNHTHKWEEKNIRLSLPINWPPHLIDALRDAVHGFIVKSAEAGLLTVALPNDPYTALCLQQTNDYYNEINAHINARLTVTHIRPTFLG